MTKPRMVSVITLLSLAGPLFISVAVLAWTLGKTCIVGGNRYGQLADGTTADRRSPVAVPGWSGVMPLRRPGSFRLASKSDGTGGAWAATDSGQLEVGATTERQQPGDVPRSSSVIREAAAEAGPFEIIGPPELVFDWTTDRCEDNDIPDLPARAFKDAIGRVQLFAGHFLNYRSIGNSLDTVRRDCGNGRIYSSANDPNYDNHKYHEWVATPYTLDGQNIYALVHNEWYAFLIDPKCDPNYRVDGWVNSLTLVQSADGGASYSHPSDYKVWTHPVKWNTSFTCGPSSPQNPSNYTRYGAFAPSNIIRKGNYYYAMYQSEADPTNYTEHGSCLMRTADVTAGGSLWEVWTGVGWDPSVTAKCSPVNRQIGGPSSLTYNTYLNSYVLLGSRFDATGNIGVVYSLSPDLLNWTSPIQLLAGSNFLYPSLLDPTDTSRNFENTGQAAYVYFTAYVNSGGPTGLDRDLMRQKVKFLPEAIPTPPIDSFWSMDEASWSGALGEVLDNSGNNNPATASCNGNGCTAPTTTVGRVARGGSFDGVDDYLISARSVFDPSFTGFTAAIWFKTNTVGAFQVLLSQQDGTGTGRFWLAQSGTGFLQSNITGSPLTGTTPVPANAWNHAAVVKQGSTITLYLNGNQEAQTTGSITSASGNTIIGAAKTAASGFFAGTLDEARIYARALSPAEIRALAEPCVSSATTLCLSLRERRSPPPRVIPPRAAPLRGSGVRGRPGS